VLIEGASASCTSYVDVADREKPAIACAAPATIECTGAQTVYAASATCSDNCGARTASCGSGNRGSSTVTLTLQDNAGHHDCTAIRKVR